MKVMWDGGSPPFSEGDLIEINRGIKHTASEGLGFEVRATAIRNKTKGGTFATHADRMIMTRMAGDFRPPLEGYVKNLQVRGNTVFDLEVKAPPIVSDILRECQRFLDKQLFERCRDKDYHDVVTNAFAVLEDRIRSKVGVGPEYYGTKLIDYAFNPKSGKLTLGATDSERESFHLIFRGSLGFLRNPPSHRFTGDESTIEAFEIISLVDLLIRLVDKSTLRP